MLTLAATASWASSIPGQQVPALATLAQQGWQPLGSGVLRWLGWRVYEAALWAPDPQAWRNGGALALAIVYDRAIPSSRLVKATEAELRRLGVADESQITAWRPALEAAFPDVAPGDIIAAIHHPGGGVAFYFGEQPSGRIDDPDFAQAFFAIWLDERTREPGLRARLLGESVDG